MEKHVLNKKQLGGFCLLIVLSILMNYFGGLFAASWKLPLWLDSAGTVLAAYLGGPYCGALVGMTGNFVGYIAYGDPWAYAIVSIAIGLLVGYAARRKGFVSLFGILTTAVMTTLAATVVATPLNYLFGNYSTGNVWGDAVVGLLKEQGLPNYLCLPVGQMYVELLDKLVILLILFVMLKLNQALAAARTSSLWASSAARARTVSASLARRCLMPICMP